MVLKSVVSSELHDLDLFTTFCIVFRFYLLEKQHFLFAQATTLFIAVSFRDQTEALQSNIFVKQGKGN